MGQESRGNEIIDVQLEDVILVRAMGGFGGVVAGAERRADCQIDRPLTKQR
jgi:hypothetical protein